MNGRFPLAVSRDSTSRPAWRWPGLLMLTGALFVAAVWIGSGCASSVNRSDKIQPSATIAPGVGYVPGSVSAVAGDAAARSDMAALVPSQSLPSPDEELWIITKPPANPAAQPPADEIPGSGALMLKRSPDATPQQMVPAPLKHTDVKASVAGYIAAVDVTQQFHNPFPEKIEAVYVFPLPSNAAVNEFVMRIGDRRIRGIIRERQEAERIYREARGQGYVASLLTQERPNIFTQSVANIEPGKAIDITIRYFNTMSYDDGWYEFAFPMVVGPRFNPPGSADGVGAVGQGARGASGQKTEVAYLKPGTRTGHDISLAVDWDAGVGIERVESRNHQVRIQQPSPHRVEVSLDPADSIPNKDFVLRCKVAGDGVKSGLVARKTERGGYFTLMLVPPQGTLQLPRKPVEFVFVLDVSGSMSGRPIEQCKAAMHAALTHMRADDTFQVVKFANEAEQLSPSPLPATNQNMHRAMQWVASASAGGGTMMIEGMRKSLDFPRDPNRLRFVAFLTDGYIGNEAEILGAMHQWLGEARVFSFGVGSSPNRYLMDHMAKMGNGAAAYLSLNDNAETVMAGFFERISHPALTDLQIDWGGMGAKDIYPRKVPDLFVGRPVILTGKFDGDGAATIRVRGKVGGETQAFEIPLNLDAPAVDARSLPAVWARLKIADLGDRATYEGGVELAREIKQVALEYGLMSNFTAFVAVDSLTRTAGDHGVSVPVPVPMPDGVRYDTTVNERPAPHKNKASAANRSPDPTPPVRRDERD